MISPSLKVEWKRKGEGKEVLEWEEGKIGSLGVGGKRRERKGGAKKNMMLEAKKEISKEYNYN